MNVPFGRKNTTWQKNRKTVKKRDGFWPCHLNKGWIPNHFTSLLCDFCSMNNRYKIHTHTCVCMSVYPKYWSEKNPGLCLCVGWEVVRLLNEYPYGSFTPDVQLKWASLSFVYCALKTCKRREEKALYTKSKRYMAISLEPQRSAPLKRLLFWKLVHVWEYIYVLNTAQSYSSEHKGFFLCYVLKDNDPKCVYLEEKFQTTNKLVLFCSSSNQLFFEKSTIWSRQKQHSQKSLQYKRKRTHTLACVCTIFSCCSQFFCVWVRNSG